jgi:hypothetical protein
MLEELCAIDEQLLKSKLARSDSKVAVAIIPTATTIKWHHVRECFLAKELFNRDVEVMGAMVGSEPGKRAWCIWQRTYYRKGPGKSDSTVSENTLHILRLVLEDGLDNEPAGLDSSSTQVNETNSNQVDVIAALLLAAQLEAAKWEQDSVELWNATPASVLAANRALQAASHSNEMSIVEPVHRETESICSLSWIGSDTEAAFKNTSWQDVEWIGNEKYSWC